MTDWSVSDQRSEPRTSTCPLTTRAMSACRRWMSRWSVSDTSVLFIYDSSWSLGQTTFAFLSVYGLLGVGVVVLNGIKTVVRF